MDEFSGASRSIEYPIHYLKGLSFTLDELKRELAKREAQLAAVMDTHANFEQNIKHLIVQREGIKHKRLIWR